MNNVLALLELSLLLLLLLCSVLSHLSHVPVFVTPWTIAYQAPLSMASSQEEYWSWSPSPPRGNLPDPGIELTSPALHADSLPLNTI